MQQIPESAYRDTLYEKLFNDEDARACRDLSDAACREVPGNFARLLGGHAASKLGDALSNSKTVLAWLMASLGAPAAMVAWLVPIRESGSMLPQLFIGHLVRRLPVRKTVWALGCLAQALAVLGMAVVALTLEGAPAGAAILALLVAFSLARGFSSVAAKDVLGKTMAKQRRGRVNGVSASVAGGIALVVGALLLAVDPGTDTVSVEALLLGIAAVAWLAATVWFWRIDELPGETGGGRNGIRDALANLRLLVDDAPFRNFVLARALFLVSALSAPFYVVLARTQAEGSRLQGAAELGLFVFAAGLADLLASPFWGRLADISSRRTMMWAAAGASALGVLVAAVVWGAPWLAQQFWWYPLAFFALGVAHAGVRLGRKTYLVDLAGGNKRTDYVSVSNTVIGALLLVTGLLGLLAPLIGAAGVVLVLSVLGFAGIALAARLPEVQAG